MRRLILLPLALLGLGTLGLASAGAFNTVHQADSSFVGVIAKLSPDSITVGRKQHHRLTCSITATSPALGAFAVGDRVHVACAGGVLVAISDLPAPAETPHDTATTTTTTGGDDARLTYAVGPITTLGGTSISVQTMTCTLGSGSPSIVGFAVGNVVRMYCKNGVLVGLKRTDEGQPAPPTTTTTTTTQPLYTAISGTIAALSSTSITVNGGDDGHAALTCTIGAGSPSTDGFAPGTPVRMYCKDGVLFQLIHPPTTPPVTTTTTTTTTTTATTTPPVTYSGTSGTITVLTGTTITVNRTSGDGPAVLSCTIGSGSPSTSGFAVGSSVRLYCANGALFQLKHNDDAPPPTTTTTTPPADVSAAEGTLSALTTTSITVGNLTCSIKDGSPSTSGFTIGSSARLYCKDGALYALLHP